MNLNKLDMKSKDIVSNNINKIAELFPNCISEGKINFDMLKQELSRDIIEDRKEKYQLTWPGKQEAILAGYKPTSNTLRFCEEKSLNYVQTKNIYIEGDNLEVLKLLQEPYLSKIDCIYIDPPYNTGKDFIYNDDFSKKIIDEQQTNGDIDEYNNKLVTNSFSNGRFHSDWLSMMYPRLKLARNLLKDTGVIFISIDDNEIDNLKRITSEIFGDNSFLVDIIWNSRKSVSNDAIVSLNHNHTLVYVKDTLAFNSVKHNFKLKSTTDGFSNPDNDPRGIWKADPFDSPGIRPNLTYEIINPNTGEKFMPPKGRCWRTGPEDYQRFLKDNRIVFGKNGTSKPQLKRFYTEAEEKGITPTSIWDDCGTATNGTQELQDLFGEKVFSTPKPVNFIKKILELATNKDSLVLDFFSGSATTAHAVMKLNAEDNGCRKYIMIQIPEKCNDNDSTYNDEYKYITEIGEERIRRAGKKIKEETNANIDYGFRVYKIDSSNMKDVYYLPNQIKQSQLKLFESNIKEDRNSQDLLTQVILNLGLTLDLKIVEKNILNNKIYLVDDNSLIACFDNEIDINVVDEICKYNPLKVVFKDESFKFDNDKINLQERFKKLSPNTEICIL